MEGARKALLLLLALGAMEAILRLGFAFPPTAERLFLNDDLSYRRAWVQRQQAGSDPLAAIDLFDPLLGWRPRPNLDLAMWGGKKLTTNAQGFRSPRDYEAEKAPGAVRLLALGDSFTFGEEVADEETWTRRLEELCPRLEVFNAGVHGYGHDQMLLLLREIGPGVRPDVVLVGYLNTDMYRNLLSFRDYAKPRFVRSGDGLALTDTPVPTPEELLRHDRWRPRLVDFGALVVGRLENLLGIRRLRKQRMTEALLREIARSSIALGARPAFAFLPAGDELHRPGEVAELEGFFRQVCRRTEGVVCLSALPALLDAVAADARCCEAPQGHWNARGHELVARTLLRSLRHEGLAGACEAAEG